MAAAADNARLLDLRRVTARFVAPVSTVAPDGSWRAVVEVTWQMGEIDLSPARVEVVASFAPHENSLAMTDIGIRRVGTRGRTPLWLGGPLSVVSTPRSLVLVDGPPYRAEEVAQSVQRGSRVVRRMFPGWDRRVVVEVAASAGELDDTLGAAQGTYAATAAVTTPVDGSSRSQAPVHVFLNPDVMARTRQTGVDLVMRHELVHVAAADATSSGGPWLEEGFAEYVALRDVSLPDSLLLAQAAAAVRRDGVPPTLPEPTQFDSGFKDLQASYEQAWLACRIIAELVGERGLRAVRRAASAGVPVNQALRRVGLDPVDLVKEWRLRLQDVAGSTKVGRGASRRQRASIR